MEQNINAISTRSTKDAKSIKETGKCLQKSELKLVIMIEATKTIKTEIQLPVDILYSLGIDKTRIEYFVKKNFLLELYREGRISLGRMAALLEVSRTEMLGIMKDSKIPLNYGVSELDEDIETAKRMGILNESGQ